MPTKNPEFLFLQQAESVARSHPEWQLILVDDHSDRPVAAALPELDNLHILRNSSSLGAGACRNIGIRQLDRPYTLFLDDDDIMHWDVVTAALQRMQTDLTIDVSLFLYDRLWEGQPNPALEHDRRILAAALQGERERNTPLAGHEELLAFTNYPWNKIYRTSFLHGASIRFSETTVQNDVFAHWTSLLRAGTLHLSAQVLCTKVEFGSARRISNTGDQRCLEAFVALRETYALVRDEAPARARPIFACFYRDLYRWLHSKATAEVRMLLADQHDKMMDVMQADAFLEEPQYEGLLGQSWESCGPDSAGVRVGVPGPSVPATPTRHGPLAMATAEEIDILLKELSRLKRVGHDVHQEMLRLQAVGAALQAENETLRAETANLEALQRMSQRKLVRLARVVGDWLHPLLAAAQPGRHD